MTTNETTLRQLVETAVEAYESRGAGLFEGFGGFVTIALHESWFEKARELLDKIEAAESATTSTT